ncbi:MAG TPA: trehalose-6-phosphate synthase [Acidimicrobiia bacterium]|nr:trehalose-6-phosphate synthase [Acidimicrobiia bacterium]
MIIASQRGPVSFSAAPDGGFVARRGAGGVVSALAPLVAATPDACWFAAAGSADDRAAVRAGAARVDGLDCRLLAVDEDARRMQVDIVCNSTLWFLYHGLFDHVRRPRFDARFREAWDAYGLVNTDFADAIANAATDGDVVIVNDYHLSLVPEMLRSRRPDLRVVHFSHTPFCGPNTIRVLPDTVAESICRSLGASAAGFHTQRWADAFSASVRTVLGAPPHHPPFAASLGPDVDALESARSEPGVANARDALDGLLDDRVAIVRVDRIEPSKNIVRGFLAFDALLDARPDLRGRVVFVARVYPSRQGLAEYLAYTNEVEQVVDRVNERWATAAWQPIVLDARDDYPRTIAALERSDVLLVNPVRDGLNLVAKEGPVLNRRDGVVCLSREAGAFDELAPAVEMVHPYDLDQTAAALATAIDLEPAARAERAKRLRALVTTRNPRVWLDDLVAAAG